MKPRSHHVRSKGGYATVVIFALLVLTIMLIMSHAITLTLLKKELRLIEKRQVEAEKNNWGHTNRVTRVVIPIDDSDGSRP